MPRAIFDKDYPYLPHSALLTFEEITRLASLLVAQGVTKVRLTGGEPLLRKNLDRLITMLRDIKTPDGNALDITLTTNGALLAKKALQLKDAGLSRVTVSLDALDDDIFKRMNDADFSVADVLHGLDVAQQVGLGPIKVNMVVKNGLNDHQIVPMARHFKGSPFVLRFIEYMDVGDSNGWKMQEVIPSAQVIERINSSSAEMALVPVGSNYPGETAQRWQYADGSGEHGLQGQAIAVIDTARPQRLTRQSQFVTGRKNCHPDSPDHVHLSQAQRSQHAKLGGTQSGALLQRDAALCQIFTARSAVLSGTQLLTTQPERDRIIELGQFLSNNGIGTGR